MARAFDNRKILFPGSAVERLPHPAHQRIIVRLVDVAAGKFRLHGDRTHVLNRHLGVEGLADRDTILIDVLSLELNESLAYRFDKTDP